MLGLAKHETIDVVFVCFVIAIALFVLGTGVVRQWTKGWMVPLGLAFMALALLVQFKF
jgi:hypothetical protein